MNARRDYDHAFGTMPAERFLKAYTKANYPTDRILCQEYAMHTFLRHLPPRYGNTVTYFQVANELMKFRKKGLLPRLQKLPPRKSR